MTQISGENHRSLFTNEHSPTIAARKFGKWGRKRKAGQEKTSVPLELADAARNASNFSSNSQNGNDLGGALIALGRASSQKIDFLCDDRKSLYVVVGC